MRHKKFGQVKKNKKSYNMTFFIELKYKICYNDIDSTERKECVCIFENHTKENFKNEAESE